MLSYKRSAFPRSSRRIEDIFDRCERLSDEDTEDASEADGSPKEEVTEMKEQMYQDKQAELRQQLQQLQDRTLPELHKKMKQVEDLSEERRKHAEMWKTLWEENLRKRFDFEKKAAKKEFEARTMEIRESILAELEEKKRQMESDRHNLDIGDTNDIKSKPTRRLRPRPNEPINVPEKRRKASPTSANILLSESEIAEDYKFLVQMAAKPFRKSAAVMNGDSASGTNRCEARIDDGKLYYEKRWFHRGQSVYIESKETGKYAAVIVGINIMDGSVIIVKKVSDGCRQRIFLSQLQKGKCIIKRRSG